MSNSDLEASFENWLKEKHYFSFFAREVKILKPQALWKSRKSSWSIDFLSEYLKIAVEIQGGTFSRGGHSRGAYQHSDFNKANYLQVLGYKIFFFDTLHVRNEAFDALEQVIKNKIWGIK
jgi:very-short-patch-repair endonuclease